MDSNNLQVIFDGKPAQLTVIASTGWNITFRIKVEDQVFIFENSYFIVPHYKLIECSQGLDIEKVTNSMSDIQSQRHNYIIATKPKPPKRYRSGR